MNFDQFLINLWSAVFGFVIGAIFGKIWLTRWIENIRRVLKE